MNIAHKEYINGEFKIQTVQQHCSSVAKIMSKHCKDVGLYNTGYLIGILHDMGKCNCEFQEYLLTGNRELRGSIDHSTVAARYLYNALCLRLQITTSEKRTAEIISMVIMSHHSCLQNFLGPERSSDFLRRINEKELPNYEESIEKYFDDMSEVLTEEKLLKYFDESVKEIKNMGKKIKEISNSFNFTDVVDSVDSKQYYFGMLIKMLHGWLIDSDWLDSSKWMLGKNIRVFNHYPDWNSMLNNLMAKYESFGTPTNDIEQGRTDIANQCEEFSDKNTGIYKLSVPTGAGKTFSVLRFALPHAIKHNMRHIIEVIPYTSIIEQNAKDVKNAIQGNSKTEYVYEHHCNMDMALDKNGNDTKLTLKRKVATERWNVPIIFTTQVRLLNMLFGGKKGDLRRLNALHNSILIFDEIQTLPIRCTYMFNLAMNFLCNICHCTIILSTATQPGLENLKFAIQDNGEIVPGSSLDDVFERFRRTHISYNNTVMQKEEIGQMLFQQVQDANNSLCIVNTTSAAFTIAKEVEKYKRGQTNYCDYHEDFDVVYLSTKLCPIHRMDIIKQMKIDLKNDKKIACVSTQLIEAGVNVSFRNVNRSLASLASVAQASGRCNRNGESDYGNVIIFDPGPIENLTKLEDIGNDKSVLQEMLYNAIHTNYNLDNILMPQMIEDFFHRHYNRVGESKLRYPANDYFLFDLLSRNNRISCGHTTETVNRHAFRTATENFEVISGDTIPILVPYSQRGRKLIEKAKVLSIRDCSIYDYMKFIKECQLYSVNLWRYEYESLIKSENIIETVSGVYILTNNTMYNEKYGIIMDISTTSNNTKCIS